MYTQSYLFSIQKARQHEQKTSARSKKSPVCELPYIDIYGRNGPAWTYLLSVVVVSSHGRNTQLSNDTNFYFTPSL